jgi:hypothetical protein
MIGMLVRNQDGVKPLGLDICSFHSPQEFLAIDSSIHQEAGALRLEQRCVARAAGRQDRNAKRDAEPRSLDLRQAREDNRKMPRVRQSCSWWQ